jgi:PAS domain S-box-containing protein
MNLSTRLAAAMVILVLLTVAAVGLLTYRSVETTILPGELERVETHARFLTSEIESDVRGARADVLAFTSGLAVTRVVRASLGGGIDPRDGTTETAARRQLSSRFEAALAVKPSYTRFRIIGVADAGREIAGVDRSPSDATVRVVADADLEQRGDRDYFKETIRLPAGLVYVSPIERNQDSKGATGSPAFPIMRVATPIFAPDGRPFGILIVDIDMRPAFSAMRSAARAGRQIFLVNDQGDYLVHSDPDREFGFENGRPVRWQQEYPELAAALGPAAAGAHAVHDPAGHRVGAALAPVRLADGPQVAVMETIPYDQLMAPALAVERSGLIAAAIAVLCAIGVAGFLARSLTRPLTAMTTAVEGFAQNRSVAVPIGASGEIGVLARAFSRMVAEVRDKTAALEQETEERRRSESALEKHLDRARLFSATVESSDDAIVTKTLDGTVTAWNPAAERMFGFPAEEAIGRSIEMIVPPERRAELHDILAKVGRGDIIQHYETVRVARDGRQIDVSLSVSPIKSPSGDVVGAAKIARDITSRLKTQSALTREIEERRQIFETSLDLILVTDRKGNFLQVSPSSFDILGYRPDEMVGRTAVDFICRDDLENTRQEMRAARSGRAMRNFTCRYMHKSGRVVALTWSGVWSEPVQKHFFSGRDMTEQKRAEEGLQDSERMARGIIDTALDAFVQMDESGTIIDWNPQAETIFGWRRAQALGRTLAELILPERHRPAHTAGLARFLESGESAILGRRLEIEALRQDGKEIKIELSVTALRRRGGYAFNGFMRDVTEKLAADEQLRQSQKMETVGQLTGGIAHDFNNILTVITGTIEILEEGVADDPNLGAIAKMIDEAAARGAELTQRLLAFARRQPLQPRTTDVNTLIVDAAKLLRPTLGEHIEIESAFEEDAWPALVDPGQLTTALLNLALNARDAMPEGGKLVLETGNVHLDESYAKAHSEVAPGPYVMIAVSDTGQGIAAAIRDKVFDPFFTTKGTGKGTGLGLSMVYGFVKQSNGHIKIYSEEGHGTTIKIYLPRSGERVDESVAGPAVAIEGGAETILVVEDDLLVRNYVAAQLGSLGYTTLTAANAAEALEFIDSVDKFDLLFTDVIMPGSLNGRQLADEAMRRRPALKVLFTSGYTENAIVHHGRLDPGVLLLAKPYRKSDLARMIRVALASGGDAAGAALSTNAAE